MNWEDEPSRMTLPDKKLDFASSSTKVVESASEVMNDTEMNEDMQLSQREVAVSKDLSSLYGSPEALSGTEVRSSGEVEIKTQASSDMAPKSDIAVYFRGNFPSFVQDHVDASDIHVMAVVFCYNFERFIDTFKLVQGLGYSLFRSGISEDYLYVLTGHPVPMRGVPN